jgi:hypothetical protein
MYCVAAMQVEDVPKEQILPAGQVAQLEPIKVYAWVHKVGTAETEAQLYPIN